MIINYVFDDTRYDFEIDYSEMIQAVGEILENWNSVDLINYILDTDQCKIDLEKEFKDELKEHFEPVAREEYEEFKHD